MPELFGINDTNVRSVMSKNVFTTFFPIAAAVYMSNQNMPLKYICVRNNALEITDIMFEDAIGVKRDDIGRVRWKSEAHPKMFDHSANPPSVDLVPELDGVEKTEMEVKLTVVPTFAGRKVTEMIVRQNTQFTLAERLAYRHRDLIDSRPLTTDKLRQVVQHTDCQLPFMLHGLWKTVGTELKLDETNTADVYVISDFAYLWMILQNVKGESTGNTRMGKVERLVRTWIGSYLESGTMRYREKGQNIEHLKITLYPIDYLKDLKNGYENLRLKMDDVLRIVPVESIKKMSPERRLDASIFLHYLMRD